MQYNVSVLQHNSVRRDTRRLENYSQMSKWQTSFIEFDMNCQWYK